MESGESRAESGEPKDRDRHKKHNNPQKVFSRVFVFFVAIETWRAGDVSPLMMQRDNTPLTNPEANASGSPVGCCLAPGACRLSPATSEGMHPSP